LERAEYQAEISDIPEAKRYFVDESGLNKFLYREYGYAPRGVKVFGKIPGKQFQSLNIIAAKCGDDKVSPTATTIVARCEYTCSMNSRLFELWFVEVLLREIPAGSFIILDNASWHRKKVLKKLAEESGCRVIFLPPYSPDFNPIENTWANLKIFIRNFIRNFSSLNECVNHYFQLG